MPGERPRIAPLAADEFSEAARAAMIAIAGAVPKDVPNFAGTMLRHPVLFKLQTELAMQLFSAGTLSARQRELAILRIAWLCQSSYTWGEHVTIAKQVANFSLGEIEDIIRGSAAPGWNKVDCAILRAVEELHKHAAISDENWSVLAEHFNDQQLIELPALIGLYQSMIYMGNALHVQPPSGNAGLAQR